MNYMLEIEYLLINYILDKCVQTVKIKDLYFSNNCIKYKIPIDSKVISKLIETLVIEELIKILNYFNYKYTLNDVQNKYPDFVINSIFVKSKYYAIDIKTSIITNNNKIGGFTLGTYKGYFKDINTTRSIIKPYKKFLKHFCLCFIYEKRTVTVRYKFFAEKWQIATKICGSGNTCNIGSIKNITSLLSKMTVFKNENEFNNYWRNY
jgi:hypothetical protein